MLVTIPRLAEGLRTLFVRTTIRSKSEMLPEMHLECVLVRKTSLTDLANKVRVFGGATNFRYHGFNVFSCHIFSFEPNEASFQTQGVWLAFSICTFFMSPIAV